MRHVLRQAFVERAVRVLQATLDVGKLARVALQSAFNGLNPLVHSTKLIIRHGFVGEILMSCLGFRSQLLDLAENIV